VLAACTTGEDGLQAVTTINGMKGLKITKRQFVASTDERTGDSRLIEMQTLLAKWGLPP
jgi:hypothetical protein